VDNGYYKANPAYARAVMLNTFAHEYGHHLQKLSGILGSSMSRQASMTPNQKLTESRRRELQATCLAAVYLGANATFTPMSGPLLTNWNFLISHSGDDYARPRVHDHGNRVSNYQWSITGFNNKKPDSCNTFTAAVVRVNECRGEKGWGGNPQPRRSTVTLSPVVGGPRRYPSEHWGGSCAVLGTKPSPHRLWPPEARGQMTTGRAGRVMTPTFLDEH
jgi:hypothetical protein